MALLASSFRLYILQVGFVITQYSLRHSSLQVKLHFIITLMNFQHYSGNGGSESSASSIRTHSSGETFLCLWVGAGGLHCGDLIRGCDFSAHQRQVHGVHGSDRDRVLCQWDSCNRELNKESLARHVEEVHMVIAHTCWCGSTFSRRDTLSKHKRTQQH